jgi:hypothetical protein
MKVRNGHAKRYHCPLCITVDAALLLDRGKAGMAATLVRSLPAAIVVAVEASHAKGVEEGRTGTRRPAKRPRATLQPAGPVPPALLGPRHHEVLKRALAEGRITPERVVELLGVGTNDVVAIANERVGLSAGAWRKLLRELQR